MDGNLQIDILDALGRPVSTERVYNDVPQAGRNVVRDLLLRGEPGSNAIGFAPTNMALGTGSAATTDTDTELSIEVYRAFLDSRQGRDAEAVFQLFLTTADANGNTLREAGLFDSPTAGNMLARVVLPTPIVKTVSIQVVFSWSILIAS
jgi:hypothetical protein